MASKFKFKLEGLLKLRHFKEEQLKVELGKINSDIQKTKARIIELEDHMKNAYESQEDILSTNTTGQMARFFPYFIQAKREDIKNQENLLYSLERRYQLKLKEVSIAMGEAKVISKMKDKEKDTWKKEKDKKEQAEIEEVISMRRKFKEEGL
ncbi:MAG: flagellar export protein FliJ [Halobacteriovoraceae bacterium]|nr:flagellar export protein FliJ [Halobacteriovoraceae bacterium]